MVDTINRVSLVTTIGTILLTWIDLSPAWISIYIHDKLWDGITYPFPNFNGATIEVWEWLSNFVPHFTWHFIAYPISMVGLKLIHVNKRGQGFRTGGKQSSSKLSDVSREYLENIDAVVIATH